MSTRSRIGIELPGGKVKSSYCHFDGYLEHNGDILLNNYKNEVKVNKLVDLGGLRSLGPIVDPDPQAPHTIRNGQPGVTEAYHRDGDEAYEKPEIHESVSDYFNEESFHAYAYLYTQEGEWLYKYMYDEEMPKKVSDGLYKEQE